MKRPLLRKIRGFTLIELLIVIVIISIVSSVALVTLSYNQKKNVESFAREIEEVMTLAEHEALLRPMTVGVGFTENAFQFYQYDGYTWQLLQDKNLKKYIVPNKIRMALKVYGRPAKENGEPVIIISESNDVTPFVLTLGEQGQSPCYEVIGEANGTLKMEPFHEA
jgi:general secretion pathway protein H